MHELKPLAGDRASDIAETIAALIDGVYIRHALGTPPDGVSAMARVTDVLNRLLETS